MAYFINTKEERRIFRSKIFGLITTLLTKFKMPWKAVVEATIKATVKHFNKK